jgi:hypothetical protein
MIRAPLDDASFGDVPWRGGRNATPTVDAAPAAPAAPTPSAPTPSAPAPETPPGVGGSEPPPSSAGDESPNQSFPVPPVPPPPSPGPVFTLAGGGGGGAASFARPGTSAAKPFRSPIFTANRSTATPDVRFGAGAPVTGGGGSAPFLPAGLGEGEQKGQGADELARIMAILRGGGGGGL